MSIQETNPVRSPKYLTHIEQVSALSESEKESLKVVSQEFVFRSNDYYLELIDWNDPNDPIRRIVMPDVRELDEFGKWDASDEASYTVVKGLEHKYPDTGLLLVNHVCGAYCRFCFRKRLFTEDNDEVIFDVTEALAYIREHSEINTVLLSGGDPLVMSTSKLEKIISQIREIDHVKIIRIGSKMLAFNPYRILNDPSILSLFSEYSRPHQKIYIMAHFNHPRELTPVSLEAIGKLQRAGVAIVNQSPIIRGVNDKTDVLTELFSTLSHNGVVPYYLFICRPTIGNKGFIVPIDEAFEIFDSARSRLAGLAKQARLCMSHKTGKIEVLGKNNGSMFFRYHRAADPRDQGKIFSFPNDPEASWLDDYCNTETAVAV
jgi:lysine 2,3-aminomutase